MTIWDTVAAHFDNATISIPVAAKARKERFDAAKAVNPTFTPSINASIGTTAMYLKAMQGQDKETKTEYVQILFRELSLLIRISLCVDLADARHR